ncbi:MAG: hypothetical protein IJ966_08070 [Bacilli bacterium]|nr:hypothetical protein [Bacilli bacterium]
MIKKVLYTCMFVLSALSLILLLFTPIYKFNDEKIEKFNTELLATIYDPTLTIYREKEDLNKMDSASKEEYIKNYKILNEFALAITEEDEEKFYLANRYEVLNALYKNAFNANGPLDVTSSQEKMDTIESTLIDFWGVSVFESELIIEVQKEIEQYHNALYDLVKSSTNLKTNEEVDNFLINSAIQHVGDEFLLLFFGYDNELIDITTKELREDGLYFRHLITANKNAWKINKSVWRQSEYKDLALFEKISYVTKDSNFYNPIPLLCVTILLLILAAGLVGLIFKGIQGIQGRRYPHAFINSIMNSVICLFVLIFGACISLDTYLSYHITEYSRLLNLLKFGKFTFPLYLVLLTFLSAVAISVVGRLCRWRRKVED